MNARIDIGSLERQFAAIVEKEIAAVKAGRRSGYGEFGTHEKLCMWELSTLSRQMVFAQLELDSKSALEYLQQFPSALGERGLGGNQQTVADTITDAIKVIVAHEISKNEGIRQMVLDQWKDVRLEDIRTFVEKSLSNIFGNAISPSVDWRPMETPDHLHNTIKVISTLTNFVEEQLDDDHADFTRRAEEHCSFLEHVIAGEVSFDDLRARDGQAVSLHRP